MESADSHDWLLDGGDDVDDVAAKYDDWAATYDDELSTWGYEAPDRCARLLRQHVDTASLALDAGCGTGLVGRALRRAGYTEALDGCDASPASVVEAERTGVYREVGVVDLQQPLPYGDDTYDGVVCCGVMTYVPDVESCWREFARITRPGGVIVVTQRDDLWADRDCAAAIERIETDGAWSTIEVTDPQPYLPQYAEFGDSIRVRYVVMRAH